MHLLMKTKPYLLFLACLVVLAILALLFAAFNYHLYTVALEQHKIAQGLHYPMQFTWGSIGADVRYGGVHYVRGGTARYRQYLSLKYDSHYRTQLYQARQIALPHSGGEED